MKKIIITSLILLCGVVYTHAQYSTYHYQRASLFETLPTSPKDIIFLGNSITDGGEWCELLDNRRVKNRGISGDVTQGVLDRLETIAKGQPAKLFLLIGVNDLARGVESETIIENIFKIRAEMKAQSPRTEIYIQSILPVSAHYNRFGGHTSKGGQIREINAELSAKADELDYQFIDLHSRFVDPETNEMNIKYSNDGLHLMGAGYQLWVEIIKPYL